MSMPTVKLRGRIAGKTIILDDEPNLPEGTPVELDLYYPQPPALSPEQRQQILQRLFSMNLPVADWEQMEREIARGALTR
jgi:predicted component of type VI protein secretion system